MPESSNRAKDIFLKALELPPVELAAFVEDACGSDTGLRRQIEAMLAAHAVPDSFLEKPAAALGPTVDEPPRPLGEHPGGERPGARLGPYKLLQQLGEGGMGVVFLAEQQQPVRRMVALKIIRAGMDSAHVVARFEQERQALAMMDHPNIAKVFDGGTTDSGRPYFVMDLIKGVPITRFCDHEHLTPRERLELFIPVCQAVQHAHQKGIIHRDLKPSNVLIALYDGKPVPKVIDFGVAKATSQKLTERTLFTEVGNMIGTLEYMAPEQAELNNLDIDTRADIYALGVLLYELLTGAPPFSAKELRSNAFAEMLRIIREVEPPRPSTRLSSSQELPAIAASRKLEPSKLTGQVRGDLDWIVMKCLEKERGRRYETANAVALDIQRYLADEPVQAGPPSAGYRLRKFVRRNRGPVTAACVVLLAVVFGIAGTTWGWLDAVQARRNEADQRQATIAALSDKATAEENARLAAQKQADIEKRRADEAGQRERAVKAHLAFERGINRLDRGQIGPGLLWLARGLEEAPEDEVELRRSLRRFLGGRCGEASPVPRAVLPEHGAVATVAYSPDGRILATGGSDASGEGWVQLWDSRLLRKVAKPFRSPEPIVDIAFSPDGRKLLALGLRARIWDVETGRISTDIKTPEGTHLSEFGHRLDSTTFSADGASVVLLYAEITPLKTLNKLGAAVWDVATGKWKFDLDVVAPPVRVAFAADGTIIFANTNAVRRYNGRTGKPIGEPLARADITGFSMHQDRRAITIGFADRADPSHDRFMRVNLDNLSRHELAPVPHLAGDERLFTLDNSWLAVAGHDRNVHLFDWRTNFPQAIDRLLPGAVGPTGYGRMAFSSDGRTLATANGSCGLWDMTRVTQPQPFAGLVCSQWHAHALAFHPDGKSLWVASEMAPSEAPPKGIVLGVRRWDLETGKELGEPLTHDGAGVYLLAVSNNAKLLATASLHDYSVRLWDTATNRPVGEVSRVAKDLQLRAIAFRPDDREVVALSRESRGAATIRLHRWDVKTGTLLAEHVIGESPYELSLAFSPNGLYCAALPHGSSGSFAIVDTATGQAIRRPDPNFRASGFAFSPDGKSYLTELRDVTISSDKGKLRLCETMTGKALGEPALCDVLRGGWGYANRMAFAPDGRTFAAWQSLMPEQTLSMLTFRDTATLKPLHRGSFQPLPHANLVVFDRSGERIAALCPGLDSTDRLVYVTRAPQPLAGDAERIRLWIEVATGQELDAGGAIADLDPKTWQERYDRLQKLGGPPTP